jgi:DNA (cytosine-5)-methyltransferase 3A
MNVLSLFDGMSCGRIALERAGIKVDKYFASEIDKYAISVAKHNYPETVHLGNVQFITKEMFGNNKIDLIIGGSPCQGFSFAGKQLNFEDERSKLFFEFVRLLRDLKPKYFLLENVRMKKESQDVITDMLGVEPIVINSKLVSAQNRHRLYWTNIPGVEQPEDKGILLKDVLEDNCPPEMFLSEKAIGRIERHGNKITKKKENPDKSATIHAGYFKGGGRDQQYVINESATDDGKSYCITARYSGAVAWNSCERKQRTMVPVEESNDHDPNVYNGLRYRKLTPVECERLQTVDDNYTALGTDASGKTVKVSNTQRYKMIGNGWTVDVITHMFKNIQE